MDGDPKRPARVSVEESFRAAKHVHETAVENRSGDGLEKARRLYERILRADPDHVGALHLMGLAASQLGDLAAAIESIQRALELSPSADAWNHLGMALLRRGSPADAEAAWLQALQLDPGHSEASDHLGTLLKRAGRLQDALDVCEAAVANAPKDGPSHFNLADVLLFMNRHSEAILHLRTAVQLDPEDSRSRMILGQTLWEQGDRAEAAKVFGEWVDQEPGDPIAHHMHEAAASEVIPARSADDYIAHVFDRYAEDFDEHLLGDLEYRVPQLMGDRVDREHPELDSHLDVLDVGCGTGLCGPRLRRHARRLAGVDLSSAMLERAAETSSYDELAQAELTWYLLQTTDSFDLIVSADTFCYFGDLRPPLEAAAQASRQQGELLFTVEEAVEEPALGFAIMPHGRYVHGAAYVRRVLAETGWGLVSMDCVVLRKEAGAPVPGLLVYARKGTVHASPPEHADFWHTVAQRAQNPPRQDHAGDEDSSADMDASLPGIGMRRQGRNPG